MARHHAQGSVILASGLEGACLMVRTTRRSVLGRGLFALGGTAGLLAIPGVARAAEVLAKPAPPSVVTHHLALHGSGWQLIGAGPRLPATPGERFILSGQLYDAHGAAAGSFHADLTVVSAPNRHTHIEVATLESHVLILDGGTITGSGTSDHAGRGTFAITGGTGRWAGATGSYAATQNRRDLGGDGTAHINVNLMTKASR